MEFTTKVTKRVNLERELQSISDFLKNCDLDTPNFHSMHDRYKSIKKCLDQFYK